MSRPLRLAIGSIACLVWACFVGIPLLVFHQTQYGLEIIDHLHAVILFLASNGLIFWLFARRKKTVPDLFVAEIVPEDEILTPFRQDEP